MLHRHSPQAVLSLEQGLMILFVISYAVYDIFAGILEFVLVISDSLLLLLVLRLSLWT